MVICDNLKIERHRGRNYLSQSPSDFPTFINTLVNWALTILMIGFVIPFSFYLAGKEEKAKERRLRQKLLSIYHKYHVDDLEG
jgi:hypothetical protein